MPQHDVSPIQQLNSKRWLQLAMTFDDPAPIVQLAATGPTPARGRLLAQRCPMCGAALATLAAALQAAASERKAVLCE